MTWPFGGYPIACPSEVPIPLLRDEGGSYGDIYNKFLIINFKNLKILDGRVEFLINFQLSNDLIASF